MVWSTEIINFIKENNIDKKLFTQSPYFQSNENIRKCLVFKYTDEEINNLNSVKKDVFNLIPFINTVKLRDYQEELLNKFQNNRFNIVVNSRQSGATLTKIIYVLHYILSNTDKNIVLYTNKLIDGVESINKLKNLYYSLPFYMKPGVIAWNQSSISFDNGVKIIVASTRSCLISNIDYLIVDDAAHIHSFDEIYRNLFPTIAAQRNSKLTLISTPNGANTFYNIYKNTKANIGIISHTNIYELTKIYWHQVKERDEQWKRRTIEELGSERLFEQEYNLKFYGVDEDVKPEIEILNKIDNLLLELKNDVSIKSVKKLNKLVKELKKIAK